MLNPLLVQTAIQELPGTLEALRYAFVDAHVNEQEPSDEEIMAALNVAFELTVDKERPETT